MKVECVKKKVGELIQKAERVSGKNLSLPILSCIFLSAKKGNFSISATNLDLGLRTEVPVRVVKEGDLAVPASVLSGFLSQLPDEGNVTFESDGGNLVVATKRTKTVIKGFSTEEFPNIPEPIKETVVTMSAEEFIKGLRSVYYSCATSSMKPELSSVYIYPDGKDLIFAATDSFRLAEKRVPVKDLHEFRGVLIPFKNAGDIIRIFDDYTKNIELQISKSQFSIAAGDATYVVSRVIDGTFPDYKQIIPKEFKSEAVLLRQDLVSALKISNVFSDTFHQINFKIAPAKKVFEMTSENSHVGKNTSTIDASVKGDDLAINFNHRYILDCFQSIVSDSVTMGFSGAHKPLVLRGVGDKTFTYLVMPMNK